MQEVEQALDRAYNHGRNNQIDAAILEYTHAINHAILYFASSTTGGLVLRSHDILVIAHLKRAQLEIKMELMEAVRTAYTKASVRNVRKGEAIWHVSRTGFRSLFYPLPACLLFGAPSNSVGFVRLDLRNDSKDRALASPETKQQMSLCGGTQAFPEITFQSHLSCDGTDRNFSSMHGTWKLICRT